MDFTGGGIRRRRRRRWAIRRMGRGGFSLGLILSFFVQSTRWLPTQLEKEIRDGTWILASVSKDVMFKSRDRLGSKRAKPLWTEVMESMGGEYKDIRDLLYGDE